jgi:hypothetical protein
MVSKFPPMTDVGGVLSLHEKCALGEIIINEIETSGDRKSWIETLQYRNR